MGEVSRCDHALPTTGQLADEQLAALRVELTHHVVEQQQRCTPAMLCEHRSLGQQQREQGHTLFSLGAVGP